MERFNLEAKEKMQRMERRIHEISRQRMLSIEKMIEKRENKNN